MFKKAAACLLALTALNSHAADQAYRFTYTGALLVGGAWDAAATTGGNFVVDDLNGDGIFTLPEVKAFSYDPTVDADCGRAEYTCKLSAFNWDPQGVLTLDYASSLKVGNGSPPFDGGTISDTIRIQPDYAFWGHFFDLGEGSYTIYEVTPQTILSITPVPEPQSYLLMAAGLLALVAASRGQRTGQAR